MESEYSYFFTAAARSDLDGIIGYMVSDLDNPTAAKSFLDKLQNSLRDICCFPYSGTPVVNKYLDISNVRKILTGNYTVYYLAQANEQKVIVLRIVYSRRNMDEIMKEI